MKFVLVMSLAISLSAQPIKWPASFENLAKKASETVDVTLDSSMLRMASKFMSSDTDQAKVKKVVEGLEGVFIKSFEFEKPGEYSQSDVDQIRSQIDTNEWKRIVQVRSKGDKENVDIFIRQKDGKNNGLFVVAAEPTELTIVQIVGAINLDDLASLEGLGIPKIELPKIELKEKRESKKED